MCKKFSCTKNCTDFCREEKTNKQKTSDTSMNATPLFFFYDFFSNRVCVCRRCVSETFSTSYYVTRFILRNSSPQSFHLSMNRQNWNRLKVRLFSKTLELLGQKFTFTYQTSHSVQIVSRVVLFVIHPCHVEGFFVLR